MWFYVAKWFNVVKSGESGEKESGEKWLTKVAKIGEK